MHITSARVIVCCPGRNFVTLKIETNEGLHGLGDATLNGREMAVVSYLETHLAPALIGRDPAAIEDIWHYAYRGAYWRRGPITMTAIAAIDVALWDIKAKMAGMPIYQLLGGPSRHRLMAYGHAEGEGIDECLDSAERLIQAGYSAVRLQCGVPGVGTTYGVPTNGQERYEPADSDLPTEHSWNTARYLNHVPKLFAQARRRLGEEVHLLHDVHHRLTPIEAARLGQALEPHRLFWMEDCVPAENQEAFAALRAHTTTPLAVGEVLNSIHDFRQLIQSQSVDYIRASLTHAGGITHMRRIADLADLYHVRIGCHGATDISPVGLAATLHFDIWAPNFGAQEHMPHDDLVAAIFPSSTYRFESGHFLVNETPGHGVNIDEELAAEYPFKRASLPVNRLGDGTLWHW